MDKTKIKNVNLILDDSRISGISIYTKDLANYLKKKLKIKCKVILPKKNSKSLVNLLAEQDTRYLFYDIERISRKTLINYIKFILFKLRTIFNFFFYEKNSIFLIQGSIQFINILILNFLKKKNSLVIHDSGINLVFKFILYMIVNKSTQIIFVSYRSYNFYKNIFLKNRIKIIPTGSKNQKKIKKNFNSKIFRIGTSCNINPDKNLEFLLKVAKSLNNYNQKIEVLIAGNIYSSQEKYFQSLKKLIKEYELKNVFFLGYQKNINKFLNKLDLYCCFSKNESSPISVWEAMHIGLPIISTDVGDLKFHINKGKFGYLIENFNEKKYAQTIVETFSDKKLHKKLSLASYKYAQKFFNRDKNFAMLANFLSLKK